MRYFCVVPSTFFWHNCPAIFARPASSDILRFYGKLEGSKRVNVIARLAQRAMMHFMTQIMRTIWEDF